MARVLCPCSGRCPQEALFSLQATQGKPSACTNCRDDSRQVTTHPRGTQVSSEPEPRDSVSPHIWAGHQDCSAVCTFSHRGEQLPGQTPVRQSCSEQDPPNKITGHCSDPQGISYYRSGTVGIPCSPPGPSAIYSQNNKCCYFASESLSSQ